MSEEHYRHIARLRDLQRLYIHTYHTVTGDALRPLADMPRLRSLEFQELTFQPEALDALAAIASLEELTVPGFGDEDEQRLARQRPDLKVYASGNYAP